MTTNTIKTYSGLLTLATFKERYEYLKLNGIPGEETFGLERYLNQKFYMSGEWRRIRRQIIVRDHGCDLGIPGYEIPDGVPIYIHHMNPIYPRDIVDVSEYLYNPEYLITTTLTTHNAIHYGDENQLVGEFIERSPNDTCPWRK